MKSKRVEGKLTEVKAWKVKNPTPKQQEYDINYNMYLVVDNDGESDTYSWGGAKTETLYRHKAGGEIGEGSVIEFRYQEESYKNRDGKEVTKKVIDRDSFYVVDRVEPDKSKPKNTGSSSYSNTKDGAHPAEMGQCLNLAVELNLVKSYKDFSDDTKVINAIKQYKFAKERIESLWNKTEVDEKVEEKEAEEHNQRLQHEDQEELPFDDDIPF